VGRRVREGEKKKRMGRGGGKGVRGENRGWEGEGNGGG